MTVSVCIPSIASRAVMLQEALQSVTIQTLYPAEVCVAVDFMRQGSAATRQRALEMAGSEWVAFLDDDDLLYPEHLEKLVACARRTDAEYVFSYFDRRKGGDPLGHFGKPWNPMVPHHTTMTVLVKRALALAVGFRAPDHRDPAAQAMNSDEDWRFTLGCNAYGAKIVHLPEETWVWNRHRGNTSGLPGKGDAQ